MTRTESLLASLTHEAGTTRKHLARLPDDQLDWRPHPRSFTAGEFGSHLVECIGWATRIYAADRLDFDPTGYRPLRATSVAGLLEAFDRVVHEATAAMTASTDSDATQLWSFVMNGKLRFQKPREAAFLDMTLHHLIHHRGQLSVYLRLLELPVPGSYGPTADDR